MCLHSLKRIGNDLLSNVVELLLQIGQENYVELFSLYIRNAINDPKEYINLMCDFLPYLTESESIFQEIINSGIVAY